MSKKNVPTDTKEDEMSKKLKRFVMVHKEGSQLSLEGVRMIFVDLATGVNYLALANGNGGSAITPLLDSEGRVLVTDPNCILED